MMYEFINNKTEMQYCDYEMVYCICVNDTLAQA